MLCDFSWREVNKHLFTPDRAMMTNQRNNSILGELAEPVTLLEVTYRGMGDSRGSPRGPPQCRRQHAASLRLPAQLADAPASKASLPL